MSRKNQLTTWSTRALAACAMALPASLVLALDHPNHDGGKEEDRQVIIHTQKDRDSDVIVHKRVQRHGSWSDGDIEVTTTVEDGHVKVIVNGDVVYDGDVSGIVDLDLGVIKLHKLDGNIALFKDGDQIMHLGDGGHLTIGDHAFDASQLRLKALEGLKGLEHLRFFEEGENGFAFDFNEEHLHELLERAREGGANAFFSSDDDDHPPVMLGINIGQGDEIVAKLHELDLDADDVTVVLRSIEGLPAARSGVKSGDIIIELEGRKNAGQNVLTEILRGKRAGETIELKVLREGEPKELVVVLEPFDGEKLGVTVAPFPPQALRFQPRQWRGLNFDGEEMSELSKKIGKLAAEMAEASRGQREDLARKMEVLTEKLTEMATTGAGNFSFAPGPNAWRFRSDDDDGAGKAWSYKVMPRIEIQKLEDGQRGYVIVSPDGEDEDDEGDSADSSNQQRIRELEAKIERLERLLRERDDDGDV